MIQNTFVALFVILFISSCAYRPYPDYQKADLAGNELRPILSLTDQPSYLFKSSLDYKDHSFSGLLLIKQMQENIYRATFTTEIGMKIFDLELNGPQSLVHYCYEPINRKNFLNVITDDIKLLLMNNLLHGEVETFTHPKGESILYRVRAGKETYFYLVDRQTGNLLKMEKGNRKGKPEIEMTLSDHQELFPYQIEVRHRDMDLSLSFKFIKR